MKNGLKMIGWLCGVLIGHAVYAQHCGYDHSALIGVRPMDSSQTIINGLRVTLIENNKPVLVHKSVYKKNKYVGSIEDTAKFWRNPPANNDENHHKPDEEKRHFIQAATDYIIITTNKGNQEKGRYIRIDDVDGAANGGYFRTTFAYVEPGQVQGLCGYPDERSFHSTYKPVLVQLQKQIDRSQFISTKIQQGYTFTLDKSPLAFCPECNGCFCQSFMVSGPDSTVLFNRLFTYPEHDRNAVAGIDSFQVDDYNFDSIPDFRFCYANNKHVYYVFDAYRKTFLEEPLLNRFDNIEINIKAKNLIGDQLVFYVTDSSTKGTQRTNENLDFQSRFFVHGSGLRYAREHYRKYLHTKDGLRAEDKTNYYKYEHYKLIPISEDEYNEQERKIANNQLFYVKPPFKFVLEKNAKGVVLPAEKGYYANRISVFEIKTNQLVHTMVVVGNKLKEAAGCSDSLQIADFNFDGYPDFRICNNSIPGKHTYYIYHNKRHTFILERTLSELYELTFDFEMKVAGGKTERKEFMGYPFDSPYQYYYEILRFEGKELANLTVSTTTYGTGTTITAKAKYINQKRMYEGDTVSIKMQQKNLMVRTEGPFRFELEFNPDDYPIRGETGAYVKVLNIYDQKRNVGHYEFQGNYLKEVPHWLDSMEIADFNFDGYPDIRMFNSLLSPKQYAYLLYNPTSDIKQFYYDTYLSLLQDVVFIPNQKAIKGAIIETNQTIFFFLKNDTLTLTTQDKDQSKPPFIEESRYRYGIKQPIRSSYGRLDPLVKREYGDYNFDGYEDFRQESKKSASSWEVFIYNPKDEAFIKDTLLSKLVSFDYNKIKKTLVGYYQLKTDELTRETYFYQWDFATQSMQLYQIQVCVAKTPLSESQSCTVSRLVNGKWIVIETFGAE